MNKRVITMQKGVIVDDSDTAVSYTHLLLLMMNL